MQIWQLAKSYKDFVNEIDDEDNDDDEEMLDACEDKWMHVACARQQNFKLLQDVS